MSTDIFDNAITIQRAERARIKSALLFAIESNTVYVRWIGNRSLPVEDPYILAADVREAVEDICFEVSQQDIVKIRQVRISPEEVRQLRIAAVACSPEVRNLLDIIERLLGIKIVPADENKEVIE